MRVEARRAELARKKRSRLAFKFMTSRGESGADRW